VFRILPSLLHRSLSTAVNQTLHDVWPAPGLVHYIHFGGSCHLTEFYQVENSLCVQVLRSSILAALLLGTRVVAVSQTLRRGTSLRNGITELSLLVIFNRERHLYSQAAITLDTVPHSSYRIAILSWSCVYLVCTANLLASRCLSLI